MRKRLDWKHAIFPMKATRFEFRFRFWILLAICLPVVLPGTLGGVLVYRRISDVNFKRVSFFLLGLSGLGLLAKVFFK